MSLLTMGTKRRIGNTAPQFGNGLTTLPGVLTAYYTEDNAVVQQITLVNTGGTDGTATVQDANGKKLLSAAPVAAGETFVINFPEGVYMSGGVYWLVNSGSMDGEIYGVAFRKS